MTDQIAPTPKQKPATIDDVARLAGVSRYAVSRAHTEGASVAPATRAKIEAAVEALGYRPNLLARSLSTQRSKLIALAVSRLENSFHAEIVQLLSVSLAERGYRILVFGNDSRVDDDPPIDEILRYQVEAVILLAVRLSSRFAQECQAANVPLLLVNRHADDPNIACIVGDNITGARAVADFLLDGEHTRLAFIAGFADSSTSRDREAGFTQRLAERGARKPMRAVGNFLADQAAGGARTLLSQKQRPDAIFCANDHMALAVIDVARREFGLDVGRQLSVVGFDDSLPARWAGLDLTTFSQSVRVMADEAVRHIVDRIHGRAAAVCRVVVPGRLIVRASARRPAGVQMESNERPLVSRANW